MRKWGIGTVVVLATFALFARVGTHEFVNFDDPEVLTGVQFIRAGLSWDGFVRAWTSARVGNWAPVTTISHMLDFELFGMNAGAHHLVGAFIHAINAGLLFALLLAMTGAAWRSLLVAALFAIHPLHVESVAWASERKDLLSGSFFLLTLGAYRWYVTRPGAWRYVAVAVFFVLGLLSKPMLVTIPFVLLLLDHWPLDRTRADDGSSPGATGSRSRRTWARLGVEKVPLLAVAAVFAIVTVRMQSEAVQVGARLPLGYRLGNAVVSYAVYLWRTIWPWNLAAYYPLPPEIEPWKILVAAAVLGLTSAAVLVRWRKSPYLATGWFWYLVMLVPVIGLVQVGGQSSADRYTYLPLIGIFIMVAWSLEDLVRARPVLRRAAAMTMAGVLVVLGMLTWRQIGYWKDSISLFTHVVAVTEDNSLAHLNLGEALASKGRDKEALDHYVQAININPDNEAAHFDLGLLLLMHGGYGPAVHHFSEVLRINPRNETARNYLAAAQAGARAAPAR